MGKHEESNYSSDDDNTIPFVNLASRGGIYDDKSFVAGYEMGILDMSLAITENVVIDLIIHKENEKQADLIAMRHSWLMVVLERDGGYIYCQFTKNMTIIGEQFFLDEELDNGE
jgi:hypothetical protein